MGEEARGRWGDAGRDGANRDEGEARPDVGLKSIEHNVDFNALPCTIYALSMLYLCSIYALSMLYLCSIYALSMLYLSSIYALSMLYLYTIYAWAMGFYEKDMKKWSMNFGKKGRKRKKGFNWVLFGKIGKMRGFRKIRKLMINALSTPYPFPVPPLSIPRPPPIHSPSTPYPPPVHTPSTPRPCPV